MGGTSGTVSGGGCLLEGAAAGRTFVRLPLLEDRLLPDEPGCSFRLGPLALDGDFFAPLRPLGLGAGGAPLKLDVTLSSSPHPSMGCCESLQISFAPGIFI
jgi:hypothetical protein